MEFEDDIHVEADERRLWELISDPEALVKCLPGAKDVTKKSETTYTGVIERSAAGLTVELDGEVEMVELDPPDRMVMHATGTDRITSTEMNADGELRLADPDIEGTTLDYAVEMEFSGKLPVHLVKSRINKDIQAFFDNIALVARDGMEALEDDEEEAEDDDGGLLNRFSR